MNSREALVTSARSRPASTARKSRSLAESAQRPERIAPTVERNQQGECGARDSGITRDEAQPVKDAATLGQGAVEIEGGDDWGSFPSLQFHRIS